MVHTKKYHLEFIMEDGDFDIYDVLNEKIFYNRKPKKRMKIKKKATFDTKTLFFKWNLTLP